MRRSNLGPELWKALKTWSKTYGYPSRMELLRELGFTRSQIKSVRDGCVINDPASAADVYSKLNLKTQLPEVKAILISLGISQEPQEPVAAILMQEAGPQTAGQLFEQLLHLAGQEFAKQVVEEFKPLFKQPISEKIEPTYAETNLLAVKLGALLQAYAEGGRQGRRDLVRYCSEDLRIVYVLLDALLRDEREREDILDKRRGLHVSSQ